MAHDHNSADVGDHHVSSATSLQESRNTSAEFKDSHTILKSRISRAHEQEYEKNNNNDAKEPPPKTCRDESRLQETSNMALDDGCAVVPDEALQEDNGRERLKKHRTEMAGRVWIPDVWGQEDLLKDWIDCSVFESSTTSGMIMSARAALAQDSMSANSILQQVKNRL